MPTKSTRRSLSNGKATSEAKALYRMLYGVAAEGKIIAGRALLSLN